MRKAWVAVANLMLAALALPAAAQGNAYAGISIGQSKNAKYCEDLAALGVPCDETDTSFRIFGGYQFHPNVAVEAGYADLGEASLSGTFLSAPASATGEAKAWDLVAVLSWPVGNVFSLYGKLGVYRGEARSTGAVGGFGGPRGSETVTDFTYALGGQFNLGRNVGMRGEWQRYNDFSGSNIDVLSLGVLYRFR